MAITQATNRAKRQIRYGPATKPDPAGATQAARGFRFASHTARLGNTIHLDKNGPYSRVVAGDLITFYIGITRSNRIGYGKAMERTKADEPAPLPARLLPRDMPSIYFMNEPSEL